MLHRNGHIDQIIILSAAGSALFRVAACHDENRRGLGPEIESLGQLGDDFLVADDDESPALLVLPRWREPGGLKALRDLLLLNWPVGILSDALARLDDIFKFHGSQFIFGTVLF